MTKTNAASKTAEVNAKATARKGKKVLKEEDFAMPTNAELTKANEADLRALAKQTGAPRINVLMQAKKEADGLAQGVNGQNSPHSAKSVKDARNKTKAAEKAAEEKSTVKGKAKAATSNKADAKAERSERAVTKKAEREAKATPKADDTREITLVDKDFNFGREGTSRNLSWLACKKSETVADYIAAGGAGKYLPRWVSAGAIKLG